VKAYDSICVIETLEACPEQTEELKKKLLEIVPLSQNEKGCISYELFQDSEHSHKFAVIMRWVNRQAYDQHCAAPFIQEIEKYHNILYQNVREMFYLPFG
jgi:quinol monooxygenase YgiN